MSSSDEFFDAESEAAEGKMVPKKPPRPPPPDLTCQISHPRPSTLPLDFRTGGSPFRHFKEVENDPGLLTPNSTIDSITAEYTKEMIIRQNRHKSQKLSNGDSLESLSNEALSVSKSSSLERERNSLEVIEAQKRCSLDYRDDARAKSRYFSCSEMLNELELKNPGLKRDDSIRSSMKSNGRPTPRRPPNPVITPNTTSIGTPPSSRATKCSEIEQTALLNISMDTKSDLEICRSPTVNDVIAPPLSHATNSSSVSSVSSDLSSIASSASAMVRRARSIKLKISRKLFKPKKVISEVLETRSKSDNQSDSSSNSQFKIKISKKLQRLKNEELPLANMIPVQEINPSPKNEPILVLKFNVDGRLLASGGKDTHVYVWVIKRYRHEYEPKKYPFDDVVQNNDIFDTIPLRKYYGHNHDILDLAWSHKSGDNWLISASMDKSVRLWHITKDECVLTFPHYEVVKCVSFHPEDNCYFVSGSLDGKLRFWNIPERKPVYTQPVSPRWKNGEIITSIVFAKNSEWILVGTYDGRCICFESEKLAFYTELVVSEKPITGIDTFENKILITSADCRIRLYSLENNSLICRYKGFSNAETFVIKALFSNDGKFIVSGSEDKHVYCWKTYLQSQKHRSDRSSYWQSIKNHSATVTSTVFAPNPTCLDNDTTRAIVSSDENGKFILYTAS